jgi:uncharacterized protein (TIGR02270 family)
MNPKTLEIIRQFAEEGAFVWTQRAHAVQAPHFLLTDLARFDSRVESYVDGLRVYGDPAWELCKLALEEEEVGGIFTAAVLAFESGNPDRIGAVVKAGSATARRARGLISALGWLSYERAGPHIHKLLAAESTVLRRIGLAGATAHRRQVGRMVLESLAAPDPSLNARALRAMGELGQVQHAGELRKYLAAKDLACQFWAAWSATMLTKDPAARKALLTIGRKPGRFTRRAVQVLMGVLEFQMAGMFHLELTLDPKLARDAIFAAGILGDVGTIPWLIKQMQVPPVARLAGEAFTNITGANLSVEKLEGQQPEGFEAGPTENPEDENVAMDPDGNLSWPNPEAIQKWWNAHQGNFAKGQRYMLGKPITPEWLQEILRKGYQRQRANAALELAIRQPGRGLFEVRAPGFRQQKILADVAHQ